MATIAVLMGIGQTISMVGSALAGFAFGVWIFQGSGKVVNFAGMGVISALPPLLITPWAGSVANRVDRTLCDSRCGCHGCGHDRRGGVPALAVGGALWMSKIPTEQQGWILALTSLIGGLTAPAVALASGYLSDRVFKPGPGPRWAARRPVARNGHGRSLALAFVISGSLGLAVSLLALANVRLRDLDHLVQDAR